MKKQFVLLLLITLSAAGASAQVPTGGNLFFGYSYVSSDLEQSGASSISVGRTNLNGWNGSLEGKVFPFVGVVADFSGHYGSHDFGSCSNGCVRSTDHMHTVMFGPRVSIPISKYTPFAHALFGVSRVNTELRVSNLAGSSSDSDTSFADALGGGLDYKVISPLALRFQADLLQTRFYGRTQGDFRFSTGLVLRF